MVIFRFYLAMCMTEAQAIPGICWKCNKPIDHLRMGFEEAKLYDVYGIKEGANADEFLDYKRAGGKDKIDIDHIYFGSSDVEFRCPECAQNLVEGEAEAYWFLTGKSHGDLAGN